MLKQQILKTIQKYKMLEPGDRVLVGVSGGPDSTALLLVLHSLSKELKIKLFAACLNHMFRKKEAEDDVRFVRRLADKLKIPLAAQSIDVAKVWRREGGSKEDMGRKIRYEFYAEAAKRFGAVKIALGHTRDDQAETVLMRLIYGAGIVGLGGIPPRREFDKYLIIRPLIETSRSRIMSYLNKKGIKARTDSTNRLVIYRRNKIRNELLPLLEKEYNPNIKATLSRTAENLRDDYNLMESRLLKNAFKNYIKTSRGGRARLPLKKFSALHTALRKYLLRQCVCLVKLNLKNVEYRHWQKLEDFAARRKNNAVMHLPGGCRVKVEKGSLVFYSQSAEVPAARHLGDKKPEVLVKILSAMPSLEKIRRDRKARYLDLGKISLPLKVRFRSPGDRFMPLGMNKYKRLQDFFVDRKIPALKRDRIPLMISKGEIVCIGGVEIADFVKITPATKKAVKIIC